MGIFVYEHGLGQYCPLLNTHGMTLERFGLVSILMFARTSVRVRVFSVIARVMVVVHFKASVFE